jgi:hemerythrin-like domain-containing protein
MSKRMIATLTAEHLVVLEMADKLRNNLERLKADQDLDSVKDGLWEFSRFMDHTLTQHAPHEEEELYPKLIKVKPGIKNEVDTMLEDHKLIDQAHRSLKRELMGEKPALQLIINTGTEMLERLEEHIQREHAALAILN